MEKGLMSRNRRKFSDQYKEEAVKMVIETSKPIAEVARDLGVNEGTLGHWVNVYRKTHSEAEPALTITERARLRELEKEVRELRMEREFLKKAAAFFASDQ
jgi:transposase